MVAHDTPADPHPEPHTLATRQQRALHRLDDGHAALLDALAGLDESEAFLGSRWSVWEVMQHLLTENFVAALEQIAAGASEQLPPFDPRADRLAADIARLEANYQRFRTLIAGLSEAQLTLPATPGNPENNYPALSLLDLIERVSGHEGSHARQVAETRKYVAAFRAAERAVTVAGLGTGDPDSVPAPVRELLANADYVIGSAAALALARPWIRAVALPLRPDNRAELVNRLARDIKAGLWSMVVTLGDPAESAPALLSQLAAAADAVSLIPAPGFYRMALSQVNISPLDAVCLSIDRPTDSAPINRPTDSAPIDRPTDSAPINRPTDSAPMPPPGPRAAVVLGSDSGDTWQLAAMMLSVWGMPETAPAHLITGLATQPTITNTTLQDLIETPLGNTPAAIDSALAVPGPC